MILREAGGPSQKSRVIRVPHHRRVTGRAKFEIRTGIPTLGSAGSRRESTRSMAALFLRRTTRSIALSRTAGHFLALAVGLLSLAFVACGPESSGGVAGPVDLPKCRSVSSFGNGALCEIPGQEAGQQTSEPGDGSFESDVDLSLCGAAGAACSDGRLCFDSPKLIACTCDQDSHCAGYADYVNQARATLALPALAPRCHLNRCDLDIDYPPEASR